VKFKYKSGEEIKKGDRVIFHGEPGRIEFVVEELCGDPAMDWYMSEFGGGVMVHELKFGLSFLHEREDSKRTDRWRGSAINFEGITAACYRFQREQLVAKASAKLTLLRRVSRLARLPRAA
jgi:hypothetical protein